MKNSLLPLILSAINWGTSDITGHGSEFSCKPLASVSPNTVLPPQLVRQSSSEPHYVSFLSCYDDAAGTKLLLPTTLPVRSSVSIDLSRIFDDDAMTQHLASEDPADKPLLASHSSIFTFDHPTDWFTAPFDSTAHAAQRRVFGCIGGGSGCDSGSSRRLRRCRW
jgi:hypothetical protein